MATPKFKPKIQRARFVVSGMKTQEMLAFGSAVNDKMIRRIKDAYTIEDQPAKPLSEAYLTRRDGKKKFGNFNDKRDLVRTGRMLGSMKVVEVNQNRAVIFFTTAEMVKRMTFNQRRSPQWGLSPSDRQFMVDYVENLHLVKTEQVDHTAKVA